MGTNVLNNHLEKCPSKPSKSTISKHLLQKKHYFTQTQQEEIIELIIELMCSKILPLSLIEDSSFIKILSFFYSLNSNKPKINFTTTNLLSSACVLRKQSRKKKLVNLTKEKLLIPYQNNNISATTDIWSNSYNNKSYFNLIVFWIDPQQSKLISQSLALIELKEAKISEYIFKNLNSICERYSIDIYINYRLHLSVEVIC